MTNKLSMFDKIALAIILVASAGLAIHSWVWVGYSSPSRTERCQDWCKEKVGEFTMSQYVCCFEQCRTVELQCKGHPDASLFH